MDKIKDPEGNYKDKCPLTDILIIQKIPGVDHPNGWVVVFVPSHQDPVIAKVNPGAEKSASTAKGWHPATAAGETMFLPANVEPKATNASLSQGSAKPETVGCLSDTPTLPATSVAFNHQ